MASKIIQYMGVFPGLLLWMAAAAWLLLGCSDFIFPRPPKSSLTEYQTESQGLEAADKAFQQGEYHRAASAYAVLRHSGNEMICRKALYGFACAQLMLAEDDKALQEALHSLKVWSNLAPAETQSEDPRLLSPVLERLAAFGKSAQHADETTKQQGDLQELKKCLREKEDRIARMSKELESLRSERDSLQMQSEHAEEMAQEIQTLKNQIKSLEVIDQGIQEKKKEVSNP